ncbi:MAG: hypothetical protein R3E48_06780 [Burkholderiaceae bacterium]
MGRIVIVTDDPAKYEGGACPPGVPVRHRTELDAVQRELRCRMSQCWSTSNPRDRAATIAQTRQMG